MIRSAVPMVGGRGPRRARRVAAPILIVLVAGCSGGGDADPGDATTPADAVTPSSTAGLVDEPDVRDDQDDGDDGHDDGADDGGADSPALVPADDARRASLVAELGGAFGQVRAGPVEIDLTMTEGDVVSEASIRVDQTRGLVDSTWIQPVERVDAEITTRNVVVDGRFYVKSTDSDAAAELLDYYDGGEANAADLLENAFTAFGRIGRSLDRVLLFVEEVPFAAATESDGDAVRHHVVFDVDDIVAFYAETGLETTGAVDAHEPVRYEFVVDGEGRLVAIDASGTQFHDGEALELTATIEYRPIGEFDLEVPPLQE